MALLLNEAEVTALLPMSLALDRILVTAVSPGATATERWDTLLVQRARAQGRSVDELCRDFEAKQPLGRIGQPEDVANLVVFLGSERASFITGIAITGEPGGSICDPRARRPKEAGRAFPVGSYAKIGLDSAPARRVACTRARNCDAFVAVPSEPRRRVASSSRPLREVPDVNQTLRGQPVVPGDRRGPA